MIKRIELAVRAVGEELVASFGIVLNAYHGLTDLLRHATRPVRNEIGVLNCVY